MILFSDDDEQEIDRTCHRLAERFEALNKNNYKPYSISASMGIFAYKPEMNLDLEQIIEIVDKNMYNNKLTKKEMLPRKKRKGAYRKNLYGPMLSLFCLAISLCTCDAVALDVAKAHLLVGGHGDGVNSLPPGG